MLRCMNSICCISECAEALGLSLKVFQSSDLRMKHSTSLRKAMTGSEAGGPPSEPPAAATDAAAPEAAEKGKKRPPCADGKKAKAKAKAVAMSPGVALGF